MLGVDRDRIHNSNSQETMYQYEITSISLIKLNRSKCFISHQNLLRLKLSLPLFIAPLPLPPSHGSPIYSIGLAYPVILSPSLIHQPLLTYKKACLSSNYIKHFQFLCPWQYIVKKLCNII